MKAFRPSTFLIAILLLGAVNVKAQNPKEADSLKSVLADMTLKDSAYFDVLQKLGFVTCYSDPALAMDYARRGLALADSLGGKRRLAKSRNLSANVYRVLGNRDEALKFYLESLKVYEEIGDERWQSNLHSNIGAIHMNDGDLESALKEQKIALQIRDKIGDYERVSGIYNSLGNIYSLKRVYDKALKYYGMALDSVLNTGNEYWEAMFLGNIGNVYGKMGDYASCIQLNHRSLAIHLKNGNLVDYARDLHNIGNAFQLDNVHLDSAIYYNERSWLLADSLGILQVALATTSTLMRAYDSLGRDEEALLWAQRSMTVRDSLTKDRISAEVRATELKYRVEKEEDALRFEQEKAIVEQEEALKRQQILTTSMGVGFVLVLGLGFVLFRRYKEKKETNILLEKRVDERTRELNTFIYRSSHDLKGPLTSIKGLVNLAQNEEAPQAYISMIAGKIEKLDEVLQNLIEKAEIESREPQPVIIDWHALMDEAIAELNHRDGFKDVNFDIDIDGGLQSFEDPYLLKLILLQVFRNSIDFRDKGRNSICHVKVSGGGTDWHLEIQDNGIGISDNVIDQVFDMYVRGDNRSKGAGLGLFIARLAANDAGMELSLKSQDGQGTTLRVSRNSVLTKT